MLNLNNSMLSLRDLPFGKTQNLELKIGRKTYLCDIEKDSSSAFVELFDKLPGKRENFSKYDANLHSAHVKPDAVLDRDFFEHIAEIEAAQRVISRYRYELK